MRKNKLHITTTVILSVLITFLFTSCFDPIYHSIRIDVKPEKPTVSGDINSIARYTVAGKEYLVLAANGGLRYKEADNTTHGSWSTYGNLPFSLTHYDKDSDQYVGSTIAKVLADTEKLYLVTVDCISGTNIYTDPRIWTTKVNGWGSRDTWSEVTFDGKTLTIGSFNVFSTNDPNPANRRVYVRIDTTTGEGDNKKVSYSYYNLQGTTASPQQISVILDDTENKKPVNSAVAVGTGTKFFHSVAVTTNGTNIYYGNGNDLYYGPVAGPFTKALSAGAPIASLALCSDAILIGCGDATTYTATAGGIKKSALDSNGKPTGLTSFTTNAVNQMPSYYMVPCLLNVDSTKPELESNIYSTVTFAGRGSGGNSKNGDKGLWSYYPNRGNWNRE